MLHLVDEMPYARTICGMPLDSVKDSDWTDAIAEVTDTDDDCNVCPLCLKAVRKLDDEYNRNRQHEIAVEEGMLHGIEAYNDVMGY